MNYKDPWAVRGRTTGCQQVVIRSCTDDPKMSTVHPQAVGELSTGCPRAGDTFGDAKGRPKVWVRPTGRPKIVFAERLPSFKPGRLRPASGLSAVLDRSFERWLGLHLIGRRRPPDGQLPDTKGLWGHRFRHPWDVARASAGRRWNVARTASWRRWGSLRVARRRRPDGHLMAAKGFSNHCRQWTTDCGACCQEGPDTSSTGFSPSCV